MVIMPKTFQKLRENPELWRRYHVREIVNDTIRSFFKHEGFHEVETPLLLPTPSTEPFLEVFETKLVDDLGMKWQAFLPSSPEFSMKKLLAAGSGSIFQITKSFRNGEGHSSRHNPEFSILEWYRTPGNYMDVARDFERLLLAISSKLSLAGPGPARLKYQGKEYDLSSPWERISVAQAFEQYAGIDVETMLDARLLKEAGKAKGYTVTEETSWEEIWNQIVANEIEPHLGVSGPTILYDYPIAQAALAKPAKDARFAERFEVFMAGVELGNCFSELTDWQEQERRCQEDLAIRRAHGKTEFPMDSDFIDALKLGMPETGGIAVGVDRLVMLFADAKSVADVLFFPGDELFDK